MLLHGLAPRPQTVDEAQPLPAAAQPLPGAEWDLLLSQVVIERMTGLLSGAVRDGSVAVTPEQREALRRAHRVATTRILALEHMLLDSVALLGRAGIDHRVLKGPATARLDYPDPGLRCFIDVDLLVPAARFDDAVSALAGAGFRRSSPQLKDGFDRRFGKGATLTSPDGLSLDLHRTLDRGPIGVLVALDDLWADPVTVDVEGEQLHALPAEQRLLHACLHAALGDNPPRLVPLRDVAQLALSANVDPDRVRRISAAWQTDGVVSHALQLAWQRLGLTDEVSLLRWARDHQQSRWDRRMLDLYLDPRKSHLSTSLTTLRVIPGMRSKAAYAAAILLPGPEYLAARGRGRLAHWAMVCRPWRHVQERFDTPDRTPGPR